MEWERSTWLAGPVVTAHWEAKDDGSVTIKLDSVRWDKGPFLTQSLTNQDKRQLLMNLIASAKQTGSVPTALDLSEHEMYHDPQVPWDIDDPYRYNLHQTDPDTHTRRLDTTYAGPWAIGYDDPTDQYRWNQVELVQPINQQDEAVLLRERDDWF
jgi:hypothetical protein